MLDLEQQIFKQIEKSKNILIVFPSTLTGDSLGASLALFIFLKNNKKTVDIVSSNNKKEKEPFSFLPSFSDISNSLKNIRQFVVSLNIEKTKVSQIKYSIDKNKLNFILSPEKGWFENKDVSTKTSNFKYDLIITINTPSLESLDHVHDNNVEFFYSTPIINIDNQSSNEDFGQINFIDLNALAVSEIIFYLLKNYSLKKINEDIATCLLTGIIHKTKNFKTTKLTPRILLTTSELINLKAKREDIINHLYRSRNLTTLKLWGKVLNNLKSENNNEILWSSLSLNDLSSSNTDKNTFLDIVDELISTVPSSKIIILFLEISKNNTQVLFYSTKNLNLLDLLREYTPQGNIKIANITLKQSITETSLEIISFLKNKLEKLSL